MSLPMLLPMRGARSDSPRMTTSPKRCGRPTKTGVSQIAEDQWDPILVGRCTTHFRTYFSCWIGCSLGASRAFDPWPNWSEEVDTFFLKQQYWMTRSINAGSREMPMSIKWFGK